ncbi:MAG: hypothetical protein OHK0024_36880 [Thalassobaculales bacterium]
MAVPDTFFYREQAFLAQLGDPDAYGAVQEAWAPTHAMLVRDLSINPLQGDQIELNYARPYFGSRPSRLVKRHARVSGKFDLASAGSAAVIAGTAPGWGIMARSAALGEVIRAAAATVATTKTASGTPTGAFTYVQAAAYTGVVDRLVTIACTTPGDSATAAFTVSSPAVAHLPAHSATGQVMTTGAAFALLGGATITPTVTTPFAEGDTWTIWLRAAGAAYSPVTTGQDVVDAYVQWGPNRHLLAGMRGGGQFVLPANAWPDFEYEGLALYSAPTSESAPTLDTTRFIEPQPVEFGATVYARLGGIDLALTRAALQIGNSVVNRSLPGRREIRVNDRQSKLELTFEAMSVADRNFIADLAAGSTLAFELLHGTAQGEAIHLSCPRCQIESGGDYADEESSTVQSFTFRLLPSDSGNDEFVLSAR